MKGFLLGLSISLAFIVGCVSSPYIVQQSHAQKKERLEPPPGVTAWEHICAHGLAKQMNVYGQQGYELVSITSQNSSSTSPPRLLYCMKRPIFEEPEAGPEDIPQKQDVRL